MATERTVLVRIKGDPSGFNRALLEAAAGVNALRKEINTTNDRTAWLTQGILAIAPAVVPLGAAAVPVFAGIAAQMTVAGVAAGTLALGFHGIGTAVKALNAYQLEPTAANLTKLQQAMKAIGPEGAQFVTFLDSLGPKLTQLQNAARAGMFPGMEDGITHLLTLFPQLKRIVSQVADGLGQLSGEAGANLAGPKFEEFFHFLETDAKPILIEMGHTVGNLADGLAALFIDLLPEAKSFSSGLESASASFAKWAHSLNGTEGFQHFLDYVNQSGPQTLAFLESLGNALLQIVEAAAPVGSHLLPVFTELLNVLAAIASTPLGSTLLAFGSLISLYGRFAAIGSNLTTGKWGAGFAAQTRAIKTGLPTWREFGNTAMHSMHSVNQLNDSFATGAKRAIESRTAVTGWLKSVGPVAGQIGLLGVIMSGADQKMGLANTASLALAGSLAGPVGFAVGTAAGAFLDMRSAVTDTDSAVKQLTSTAKTFDLSSTIKQINDMQATLNSEHGLGILSHPTTGLDLVKHGLFGGADVMDKQLLAIQAASAAEAQNRDALTALFGGLNKSLPTDKFGNNLVLTTQQLTDVATRAQPAMDALGISVTDLQHASQAGDGSLQGLVSQIVNWTKHSDSAAARSANVKNALHGLDAQMLTTQQAAAALSSAMDALFGPKMGLNAAHNAWLEGLRALHSQLDSNSKAVLGNSDAALKNQDAIRGVANNMLDYLKAQADAGASSDKVTATYRSQRAALIQTAHQLGISKSALEQYLHTIGLTPKAVTTLIKTAGTDAAKAQIQSVKDALAGIDRVVNVHVNVTRSTNSLLADVNTPRKADGGYISGPGGPRDDAIPAWLSNGEFVVNAAATSRNLGLLHSINAQRFADGGPVVGGTGGLGAAADGATSRLHGLQHAIDQATKSVDAEKAARDKLRSNMQQLSSTVSGGFRSDFLGVTGDGVWTQASNPFSILRGDIHDARAYNHAVRDLKKRGVSGQFAAQIDSLAAAQQVDALSNRRLHNLEHLFSVRQNVSTTSGSLAGQTAYGHKLDQANRELHQANTHLRALQSEMKHLKAEQAKNAKATGDAVGNTINGSASRAVRRKRR